MSKIQQIEKSIMPVLLPCGVERVAIFGSIVRDEDTDASDVDILVKLKARDQRPPISMFQWIELEAELSHKLNRKVDLVSEDGLSPYIRPHVEQERVIVYEEA